MQSCTTNGIENCPVISDMEATDGTEDMDNAIFCWDGRILTLDKLVSVAKPQKASSGKSFTIKAKALADAHPYLNFFSHKLIRERLAEKKRKEGTQPATKRQNDRRRLCTRLCVE